MKYDARKSKYAENVSPVYVSDNMSGKMHDIPAISTSCKCNERCLARMKNPDLICHYCFADATTDRYDALQAHLEDNVEVLTDYILPMEFLPRFKEDVDMLRFEAFGDLINATQAGNYIRIARANPQAACALWTKNPDISHEAVELWGKPANLQIIYSSPVINDPVKYEEIATKYPEIDKVFTVYDPEYIKANGIDINCGARDCKGCRVCYERPDIHEVREMLK